MPHKILIVGKTFGRLKVISDAKSRGNQPFSLCHCVCGTHKEIANAHLRSGFTRSCGCLRKESLSRIAYKHGASLTPEQKSTYSTWKAMRRRCNDPSFPYYACYGGRGIKVCERWGRFENFLEDMGIKPIGFTIERINNDGNYEPSNCRWGTRKEQNRNKRNSRMITAFGITACAAEIGERFGVKGALILSRVKAGWSPENSILTPSSRKRSLHNGID